MPHAASGRRQGMWHPFRLEVMDQLPRRKERQRKPDISVALFRRLMDRVPEHTRPVFWTLVILGLRVKTEYLRLIPDHLRPHTFGVLAPEAKSAGAVLQVDPDLWHWILDAVPSPIGYQQLTRHWHAACLAEGVAKMVQVPCIGRDLGHWQSAELARHRRCTRLSLPYGPRTPPATVERYMGPTLHDLRHCHGQWLTAAGVAEAFVQASLRHQTPDQTRGYTMQEVRGRVAQAMAQLLCSDGASPPRSTALTLMH